MNFVIRWGYEKEKDPAKSTGRDVKQEFVALKAL